MTQDSVGSKPPALCDIVQISPPLLSLTCLISEWELRAPALQDCCEIEYNTGNPSYPSSHRLNSGPNGFRCPDTPVQALKHAAQSLGLGWVDEAVFPVAS